MSINETSETEKVLEIGAEVERIVRAMLNGWDVIIGDAGVLDPSWSSRLPTLEPLQHGAAMTSLSYTCMGKTAETFDFAKNERQFIGALESFLNANVSAKYAMIGRGVDTQISKMAGAEDFLVFYTDELKQIGANRIAALTQMRAANPFGLPEGAERFYFGLMLEMARKNGYEMGEQNLVEQLNHHWHNTTRIKYKSAKRRGIQLDWTEKSELAFDRESFISFLEKRVPKWRRKKE